jgi:hypothetical protein
MAANNSAADIYWVDQIVAVSHGAGRGTLGFRGTVMASINHGAGRVAHWVHSLVKLVALKSHADLIPFNRHKYSQHFALLKMNVE